jgi:hypothetical protein
MNACWVPPGEECAGYTIKRKQQRASSLAEADLSPASGLVEKRGRAGQAKLKDVSLLVRLQTWLKWYCELAPSDDDRYGVESCMRTRLPFRRRSG